jgi:hypothetical protein
VVGSLNPGILQTPMCLKVQHPFGWRNGFQAGGLSILWRSPFRHIPHGLGFPRAGGRFFWSAVLTAPRPDAPKRKAPSAVLPSVGSYAPAVRNAPSGMTGISVKPQASICVLRSANAIERDAGLGLASMAFDLEPTEAAIEALPDRR